MNNTISKPKLYLSRSLLAIYRIIFLRKAFFKLNRMLFGLSLRGLGILNYENDALSGEEYFLNKMSDLFEDAVAIDIGANKGDYSNTIRKLSPRAKIYAFEPHPKTFEQLQFSADKHNYMALNLACSDIAGKLKLYDYQGDQSGSEHASLYQDVIEKIHKGSSAEWDVDVTTIDRFVQEEGINKISLLKIDTEGNELKVLLGAKQCVEANLIDVIHLEFNEMNVVSRVFMKDIYEALDNYLFYRLLPDGLVPLGEYTSIYWEIFGYQNIIAVNKNSLSRVKRHLSI